MKQGLFYLGLKIYLKSKKAHTKSMGPLPKILLLTKTII